MAEEQTSIDNRKDHLQGEPTRESICHNTEARAGTVREEREGSPIFAGTTLVEVAKEDSRRKGECMVKSIYFASSTVELVNQPPA
jgi:hypothetical protein